VVTVGLLVAAAVVLWRSARKNEQVTARLTAHNHLARLGEMSAVLAHELRNPLAALKGHAQSLAERLRDGDLKPASIASTSWTLLASACRYPAEPSDDSGRRFRGVRTAIST
jgi:signal transduction histidine kinase